MKLVDILARELKVWPEDVQCLTQSNVDREIYDALDGAMHSSVRSLNPIFHTTKRHSQERESYPVVTRAQWQTAVDALKAEASPAWVGVGKPPVGTVCEFHGSSAACPDDPWHPDLKDGDHVTIIAYFSDSVGDIAAFTFKARNENIAAIQVEQARPGAFRPIRTPEQIAAGERERAITDICVVLGKDPNREPLREKAGVLYDAGYRKFEIVDKDDGEGEV